MTQRQGAGGRLPHRRPARHRGGGRRTSPRAATARPSAGIRSPARWRWRCCASSRAACWSARGRSAARLRAGLEALVAGGRVREVRGRGHAARRWWSQGVAAGDVMRAARDRGRARERHRRRRRPARAAAHPHRGRRPTTPCACIGAALAAAPAPRPGADHARAPREKRDFLRLTDLDRAELLELSSAPPSGSCSAAAGPRPLAGRTVGHDLREGLDPHPRLLRGGRLPAGRAPR